MDIGEGVVELLRQRATDREVEGAAHIALHIARLYAELFEETHDLVHQGIVESDGESVVDGTLDDGGMLDSITCGGTVGVDEAGGAEQDTAEIADDDDESIGEVGGEQLSMDRTAGGARRLTVVVAAIGVALGAEDIGIAMMAGVEIGFAEHVEMLSDLLDGSDREGESKKLAALILKKALGGSRNSMEDVGDSDRRIY